VAYFIRPVDRELMPNGHDWLMIETPDGDATFFVSRDAECIEVSPATLAAVVPRVGEAAGIPFTLAS
jgi:hypothetical protein